MPGAGHVGDDQAALGREHVDDQPGPRAGGRDRRCPGCRVRLGGVGRPGRGLDRVERQRSRPTHGSRRTETRPQSGTPVRQQADEGCGRPRDLRRAQGQVTRPRDERAERRCPGRLRGAGPPVLRLVRQRQQSRSGTVTHDAARPWSSPTRRYRGGECRRRDPCAADDVGGIGRKVTAGPDRRKAIT